MREIELDEIYWNVSKVDKLLNKLLSDLKLTYNRIKEKYFYSMKEKEKRNPNWDQLVRRPVGYRLKGSTDTREARREKVWFTSKFSQTILVKIHKLVCLYLASTPEAIVFNKIFRSTHGQCVERMMANAKERNKNTPHGK